MSKKLTRIVDKDDNEIIDINSLPLNQYCNSKIKVYSCNYVNNASIETIYNNNETFTFNGNAYASKNITLPKNISNYKVLLINVGEPYGNATYYEQMLIPADLLISGNIFRKFIFLAGIQSYMQIKYNSANSIEIWLEHTSAISGSRTIKVNIVSLNNYSQQQTTN